MPGSVVNVTAMLTGNATGMVNSFGMGSEAAKKFKDAYAATGASVTATSKEIQDSLLKEAAAAQAAAQTAVDASARKAQAASLAAAQATVAADKEAAAQAKAAAAAQAAADATARAAATGSEADTAAAAAQVEAAGRAANAATLAAEQKSVAAAKAAAAQAESTASIKASLDAEKAADAATAAAADMAAAKKKAASDASMATMTKVAVGTAVAAGVVAVGVLDMAGKYEKSTQLLMTAGGESQSNMQMIRDGILKVAQTTGIGAEQLSEGMYTVEKATFRGADGLNVLKAAAEGAAAENVDMGTMTNALTSIMMSYHLTSDKAVATTNELVAGAGAAKTTMQDYAASLSSVLPVASAAGISFAEVGGAIATLTQHGTSADESTQELANTIRSLQAPNNVAISAMQQLGLSVTDVETNLGKRGLTGTIQMITDAIQSKMGPAGTVMIDTMKKSATGAADLQTMISKMPANLQTAAQGFLDGTTSMKDFQKVFKGMGADGDAEGKQFLSLANTVNGYNDQIKAGGPAAATAAAALKAIMGGATGMNTALMLGGENMTVFKQKTDEVAAAAQKSGADISTNAATQSTLAATTARVKETFEALAIELGTMLMPAVKDILNGFLQMVTFFQQNKGAAEALGLGIAALAGGIIAGVLAAKAWAAMQVIAAAATAIFTGNFEALNAVMAINPFIAIAIGLAALVAGVIWAYNNIGWFKDGVDAAWKWIQQAFNNAIGWIVNTAFPWLGGAWKTTVQIFQNSVGMFTDFFTNTYGMFHDFVSNTVGMFSDFTAHTVGMFVDFFRNTYGMFSDFFGKVGAVATWFWKNVMEPVWNGIVLAAKLAITIIGTVVIGPMVALFNVLAAGAMWLWKNAIKPAWDGISAAIGVAWNWIRDNVINPMVLGAELVGKGFEILWKTYIVPVWDGIKTAIANAWNWLVQNVWNPIVAELKLIEDDFTWLWKNIIVPVWDGIKKAIGDAWNWIRDNVYLIIRLAVKQLGDDFNWLWKNIIVPVWDGIQAAIAAVWNWIRDNIFTPITNGIHTVGDTFTWLWHNVVEPAWSGIQGAAGAAWNWIRDNIFNPFKQGINDVGQAFQDTAGWIGRSWDAVKGAASVPVHWIVDNVYTNGIEKVWNGIAGAVGLNLRLPDAPHFATGGIMPGYSPGVDNFTIQVGGGEAIMRPEWTRMVGADNVHRMNAMAAGGNLNGVQSMLGGLPGFAGGGVVGFITDAFNNIGNAVGGFLHDPLGGIANMITGPMNTMLSGVGGGNLGKMVAQFPREIVSALGNFIKGPAAAKAQSFDAAQRVLSAGVPISGATMSGGAQQWAGTVMTALNMLGQPAFLLSSTLRRMNQESGGNPNAINNWDSNAAAGIPSKGLMQVIPPTFAAYAMPGYASNIYDPLSNILASMRYAISRYGNLANAYDRPGGYAMGGIAAPVFDNGGWVKPGLNLINNKTGAPERLSNTTGGMEGATFVLEIPELGGRLTAKVKEVIADSHSELTRSLRNTAGIDAGGN